MNVQCIYVGQRRVGTHSPLYVCGDQKTVECGSCLQACLGTCVSVVHCCLGRLADLWHLEISPVSASDLTANSYQCPWFYISSGPLESGVHVCTANNWPTEPCFHPREVSRVRFQFNYNRSTPLDQCVNLAGYLRPPAVWQAGRLVCVHVWKWSKENSSDRR